MRITLSRMVAASITTTVLALTIVPHALTVSNLQQVCEGSGGTWNGSECVSAAGNPTVMDTFTAVSNMLLYIMGAVAVIMIIIGGVRYATSNGEQAQVTSAKNTILYAIIGLVVALVSYAIVNFVLTNIT